MIRPVRIQHPDFRHGRIALFFHSKIILNVQKVLKRHGKVQGIIQFVQLFFCQLRKSIQNLHVVWFFKMLYQRIRLLPAAFPGIYRIDSVLFDRCKFCIVHVA